MQNTRGVRLEQEGNGFRVFFSHNDETWDVGDIPQFRVGDKLEITFERVAEPALGRPDLVTTVQLVSPHPPMPAFEPRKPRRMDS